MVSFILLLHCSSFLILNSVLMLNVLESDQGEENVERKEPE